MIQYCIVLWRFWVVVCELVSCDNCCIKNVISIIKVEEVVKKISSLILVEF
jgi:hypothetical protein